MRSRYLMMMVVVGVAGCGGVSERTTVVDDAGSSGPEVAMGIGADSLLAQIEVLASDEFGGRAPGSPGEVLTIAYLTEQFAGLGLSPGNPNGGWVQPVPLVGITPMAGDLFQVSKDGESRDLEPGRDYVASTKHVVDQVEIDALSQTDHRSEASGRHRVSPPSCVKLFQTRDSSRRVQ